MSNGSLLAPLRAPPRATADVGLEAVFMLIVIGQFVFGVLLRVFSQAYLGQRADAGAAFAHRCAGSLAWSGSG